VAADFLPPHTSQRNYFLGTFVAALEGAHLWHMLIDLELAIITTSITGLDD
jgi:hypothetical protein